MLGKYIARVHQNKLGQSKRRRVVTERFEKLEDLCKNFDALSPEQKTDQLFHYMYCFSNLDTYTISEPDCTGSE